MPGSRQPRQVCSGPGPPLNPAPSPCTPPGDAAPHTGLPVKRQHQGKYSSGAWLLWDTHGCPNLRMANTPYKMVPDLHGATPQPPVDSTDVQHPHSAAHATAVPLYRAGTKVQEKLCACSVKMRFPPQALAGWLSPCMRNPGLCACCSFSAEVLAHYLSTSSLAPPRCWNAGLGGPPLGTPQRLPCWPILSTIPPKSSGHKDTPEKGHEARNSPSPFPPSSQWAWSSPGLWLPPSPLACGPQVWTPSRPPAPRACRVSSPALILPSDRDC